MPQMTEEPQHGNPTRFEQWKRGTRTPLGRRRSVLLLAGVLIVATSILIPAWVWYHPGTDACGHTRMPADLWLWPGTALAAGGWALMTAASRHRLAMGITHLALVAALFGGCWYLTSAEPALSDAGIACAPR